MIVWLLILAVAGDESCRGSTLQRIIRLRNLEDEIFGTKGRAETTIELNEGTVEGYSYTNNCIRDNCLPDFEVFKAVPYAKPPLGSLSWKKSEPIAKFDQSPLPVDRHRAMCHTDFEDADVRQV